MKKSKKRKNHPPKRKRRVKAKPLPKVRNKLDAGSPEQTSSPMLTSFDQVSQSDPAAGLLARAAIALQEGNPHEAFDFCRKALGLDPENPGAFNLAGIAAFHAGLAEEGLTLLQIAVDKKPSDAEAQTNLGNVLMHLDRIAEAENAYQAAMAADPGYADAFFNFGLLNNLSGQQTKAVSAFTQALNISPTHSPAQQGLGDALKALGQLDRAKLVYETVLDKNPALSTVRTNLAAVLHELGDFDAAAGHCRLALEASPELTEARYNLGIVLQEQGRYKDAIDAYEQVLVSQPGRAAAALNIAYALQQMGKQDAAVDAIKKTLDIDPEFTKAHVNLADLYLQQGNPSAALEICDSFLARHPGNTDLLAFKAITLTDCGEIEAAQEIVDFDRFLWTGSITPPAAYADLADFNTALSEHVTCHPTLSYAPLSHATRKGRHSGELLNEPKGPIAALEKIILSSVDDYREKHARDNRHPFLASIPDGLTLSVWGVVLQAAGHQISHIHPAAWLSGIYYPKIPDVVSADKPDKAGWIQFGQPPDHFHNQVQPETISIKPEAGLIMLFPSYFYHHTIPFEIEDTRISIAFDLMPVS